MHIWSFLRDSGMTYYPDCAVALSMGSRVEVRLPTVSNNCSPSANHSRLRAEEGEVSSEGRLLPFFCLSCDVTRDGMCSNGVLESCYKPATNTWPGLQMEHFLKFVASLYGANVATNLLQTRICYFTFSPN